MRFIKKACLIIALILANCTGSFAQDSLEISLLTCYPGEELYSIFGHTGIRVVNYSDSTDIVYNYGMFNFSDPLFYTKYIKGTLLYYGAKDNYDQFMFGYRMDQRKVVGQTLNLNNEDKQKLIAALEKSIREENKYFHYDFLYKNCSTEARDIFEDVLENKIKYPILPKEKQISFMQIIDKSLKKMPWERFGIDLLLCSEVDQKMSARQRMFLPLGFEQTFDATLIANQPLVRSKYIAFEPETKTAIAYNTTNMATPLYVFTALLAAIVIATFFIKNTVFWKWFDAIFFTTIGLLGILFLYMWLGTNHIQTEHNLHTLWALPTHVAWVYWTSSNRQEKYLHFSLFLCLAAPVLVHLFQHSTIEILLINAAVATRLIHRLMNVKLKDHLK